MGIEKTNADVVHSIEMEGCCVVRLFDLSKHKYGPGMAVGHR